LSALLQAPPRASRSRQAGPCNAATDEADFWQIVRFGTVRNQPHGHAALSRVLQRELDRRVGTKYAFAISTSDLARSISLT